MGLNVQKIGPKKYFSKKIKKFSRIIQKIFLEKISLKLLYEKQTRIPAFF